MSVRVHRVKLYKPKAEAIRCLAYDSSISRLAVGRADSSIEIWDVAKSHFLEKVIPGSPTSSVETLSWCDGRLFSAGLCGYVSEYDLTTLVPKYQLIVFSGSPVWCMDFDKQKTCLAVGNEEGHVVLHDLSPEGLNYQKKFDKQNGCILCLTWHKDGCVIVTGSMDIIRVWNVQTGHVINRIILGRADKGTPTIVWCIAITCDMTIISGDSCGKTSFWNGNNGTLISSIGVHKSGVLAMCMNENEDAIHTAGVDSVLVENMKSESNGRWMKSRQRYYHTHDVRALQIAGDFLASGGDDCNLIFSKLPPTITEKHFPFCQMSYTSVASEASCILFRYPDYLELWKIGVVTPEDNGHPVCLGKIMAKSNERVVCSVISSDGKWVAYSSEIQLRLFKLNMDIASRTLALSKIKLIRRIPNPTRTLLFTSEPTNLIFYSKNKMHILNCVDNQHELVTSTIEEDPDSLGQVHIMEVSSNNKYLACGSHNGNVVVYSLETKKLYCKLPLYNYQPTVLAFDPASENLIVVYTDRKVVEYSLQEHGYTPWTKQNMFLEFQKASFYPITSAIFKSENLFLQDERDVYVFKKDYQQPAKKKLKNSNDSVIEQHDDSVVTITKYELKNSNDSAIEQHGNSFITIPKYEHISSMHSLSSDIVMVFISSNVILESLPPPIWKKKYGT